MNIWPLNRKSGLSRRQEKELLKQVVSQLQNSIAQTQVRPDYWTPYQLAESYLPNPNDPAIFSQLRQAIPMLGAAVESLIMLTGRVKVVWDSEAVQAQWDEWARSVKVAPLGYSLDKWLNGYMDRALVYGTGAAEIVPDASGKDIYAFQYLSSASLRMRVDPENPLDVVVAQQQRAKPAPIVLNREFITLTANNSTDETPYGKPLFADIPFVAELLLEIVHATKQDWIRLGAPSMAVLVGLPTGLDPSIDLQKLAQALLTIVKDKWEDAMTSRQTTGKIKDFFGVGDLKVVTVGADGKPLDMTVPWRSMLEQIISVTHLPPWMLGLHWSTTERLSSEQAESLEAFIADLQADYTPAVLWVVDWWKRVRGLASAKASVEWQTGSIRDKVEMARAELIEAQAQKTREDTASRLWRNGVYDQQGYADAVTEQENMAIAVVQDAPAAAIAQSSPFGPEGSPLSLSAKFGHAAGCTCGAHKAADNAQVSYGQGETPNDERIASLIDQFYGDARKAVRKLKDDTWRILQLPDDVQRAEPDPFSYTAEQTAALDAAIEKFLTEMAGRERSKQGFVNADTGDGIIQQYDTFAHRLGVARAVEMGPGEAATVDASRNGAAVQSLLEHAFDRLSDSGKLRLDEGTRSGIYDVLEQAVALGENPIGVARELSNTFDGYEGWQMERLARTEVAFAQNAGQVNEFKADGIDCTMVEDLFPLHPHCQCDYSLRNDGTDAEPVWVAIPNVSASACELCQTYAVN